LYELLVGIPPFNASSREEIFDNIRNLQMDWPEIGYDEDCITPEAVDLIKKLLNPNPNTRLGAKGVQEIKNHKFFENFDWEGVTEREAPIIPDCKIDLAGPVDGPQKHPFSDSEDRRKNKPSVTNSQAGRRKFFNMIRIELLQKMTLARLQLPQQRPKTAAIGKK